MGLFLREELQNKSPQVNERLGTHNLPTYPFFATSCIAIFYGYKGTCLASTKLQKPLSAGTDKP
jgi:hypothetical protein